MKIKNLVWLISLMMIVPFSLVSCKDDNEPQKEEQEEEQKEGNKEEGKNPSEGQDTNKPSVSKDILLFDQPTVKVHKDLSITISAQLRFNLKIKKLIVIDTLGNLVYDFLQENQELNNQNIALSDSPSKSSTSENSVNLSTTALPLNDYKILITTSKSDKDSIIFETNSKIINGGAVGVSTSNYGEFYDLDYGRSYTFPQYQKSRGVTIEVVAVRDDNTGNVAWLWKGAYGISSGEIPAMIQDGEFVEMVHENGFIITKDNVFEIKEIKNIGSGTARLIYRQYYPIQRDYIVDTSDFADEMLE